MKQFALKSDFGRIVMLVDDFSTGIDSRGRRTQGGLCGLRLNGVVQSSIPVTSQLQGYGAFVAQQIEQWLRGELIALDSIGVAQVGTPFKQAVWQAMRGIQPGDTDSYAGLAVRAKNPTAVRAAASACATNGVPLVVPCHRVVRTNGEIGNYFYGADVKLALLTHEGVIAD